MDDLQTNMVEFLGCCDWAPLLRPLVRLAAQGDPVPLDRLAAEAGVPVEQVERRLRAEPGVDWDAQGRLLGFGLTQRPTQHRLLVGGRELYAFCAADTLMLTLMLDQPTTVESPCAATGQPIRIELTPQAVTSLRPTTAVLSQVRLCSSMTDIRAQGCDHGHFFATADAAQQWQSEHPEGEIRPVKDFFTRLHAVGRELRWAG